MFNKIIERATTIVNWPMVSYPFNRLGSFVAVLWNGAKFRIRSGSTDYGIIMEVYRRDIYRLAKIKNPSWILDIGANVGVFTVLAARRFPHATVVAVEPEPSNFAALQENVRLNKLKNVVMVNAAVSDGYGQTTLYLDDENNGCHSILGKRRGGRAVIVPTVPLSHFGKVDAIKCDAEGAEYLIFKEAPDCKYLGIEIHEDERREALLAKLSRFKREDTAHNVHVFTV